MKIQDATSRFLVQLEADGRSPHTISQYRRHVGAFATWLAHGAHCGEVNAVGHEDVARFLAAPVARTRADGATKKATSMNAARTSLRVFFRYMHEAGMIGQNPARLVRYARCTSPPPKALSDDDRERLLATLSASDCPRDYAIFALMLATGIRLGSAVALDTEDVDLDRGELRLRSMKGNQPAVVFLGQEIRQHLATYIGSRRSGPLFCGRGSARITTRQVQRRMEIWVAKSGIQGTVTPHTCRHTFATRLLRRADLTIVQAALCHRSITSTLVYARVDAGRVRAALA